MLNITPTGIPEGGASSLFFLEQDETISFNLNFLSETEEL